MCCLADAQNLYVLSKMAVVEWTRLDYLRKGQKLVLLCSSTHSKVHYCCPLTTGVRVGAYDNVDAVMLRLWVASSDSELCCWAAPS